MSAEPTSAALAATCVAPDESPGAGGATEAGLAACRYASIEVLGEGGMGHVERVRDHDLLRDVAVKTLRTDLPGATTLSLQFLWEARVTAYLDHPNIIPVHDLGAGPDGQLYFIMKLARGETLGAALRKLKDGTLDAAKWRLPRRLRLFLQLCQAVGFAHAQGVLHRDLKPDNVLLGDHGEILVTDWGLAVPLDDDRGAELRKIIPEGLSLLSAGTPMYMSPEQVDGGPLDARSDVYTLGVILYELVALEPPFVAEDVPALLDSVRRGEHRLLTERVRDLPAGLSAVVNKAMQVDPARRYEDVGALSREIEAILDGRVAEAEDASLLTQAARYYGSHDPGMSKMRVVDIDFWVWAGVLMGVGVGAYVAPWLRGYGWLAFALGVVFAVRPTVRWLAYRRAARRDASGV